MKNVMNDDDGCDNGCHDNSRAMGAMMGAGGGLRCGRVHRPCPLVAFHITAKKKLFEQTKRGVNNQIMKSSFNLTYIIPVWTGQH